MTVFLYLALAVFGMEMAAIIATTHTLTATLMADRELLQRHCARPPFAIELLHRHGPDHLLCHCPKLQPGSTALVFCSHRRVDLHDCSIGTGATGAPVPLVALSRSGGLARRN
jgi:hypothetical protein